MKPLAIDLFCGSFGWAQGWLELGGRVVGFDLEHEPHHGPVPRGADLVLQDVRTIDGAQFRDASLILASSPCQEFSYRAMPWKRAKALGPPLLGMELFAQAERIQREAIEASICWTCEDWIYTVYCDDCKGTRRRFIPMVQENVRGAQKWVGRARWHYGSYYLWGDVPALMPITLGRTVMKRGVAHRVNGETNFHGSARRANGTENLCRLRGDDAVGTQVLRGEELRLPGVSGSGSPLSDDGHQTDPELSRRTSELEVAGCDGLKVPSASGRRTDIGNGARFTSCEAAIANASEGRKGYASGTGNLGKSVVSRMTSSTSPARKAASARIAKIPLQLSRHIARVYFPEVK